MTCIKNILKNRKNGIDPQKIYTQAKFTFFVNQIMTSIKICTDIIFILHQFSMEIEMVFHNNKNYNAL